jgi:hypothetical protein
MGTAFVLPGVFGSLLGILAVRIGYIELALHDSSRVNADRESKGQALYTVVHGSDGTEWSLERG